MGVAIYKSVKFSLNRAEFEKGLNKIRKLPSAPYP